MKKIILCLSLVLYFQQLLAQTKPHPVTGLVRDSISAGLTGGSITLTSPLDTLKATTDSKGNFLFRQVKSSNFTLSVNVLGYHKVIRKFIFSNRSAAIAIDPIFLHAESIVLNQVTISGTPSITYKTDTVEYRATDYKVKPNATVDEMLKKMEGIEVGKDGTVTHQGQQITAARLNGRDYFGGDVATAIQNLPADIVSKMQIIDDYGKLAARTGIKDAPPQKVLNIVTKSEKSIGNLGTLSGGLGNNDRYESRLYLQRINKDQQIGLNASLNNTINGIAPPVGGSSTGGNNGSNNNNGNNNNNGGGNNGGSPGSTRLGTARLTYEDLLLDKINIDANYSYNDNNTRATNSSLAQLFSTKGTTFVSNEGNSTALSRTHNFNADIESDIDKNNYLNITPRINYTTASGINEAMQLSSGLIHQYQSGNTTNSSSSPRLGFTLEYQHKFSKPRRNISFRFDISRNNQLQDREQDNIIRYYQAGSDAVLKDSLIHRLVNRGNLVTSYRAGITYSEPLGKLSRLDLSAQTNYNGYNNQAFTGNIDTLGKYLLIDSLSNVFRYHFIQTRFSASYRVNTPVYNLTVGITALPTLLEGTKISTNSTTSRRGFNVVPIIRWEYTWSKQKRLTLNYNSMAIEPSFDQLQPVRDVSNPQNPVVGNPDLKSSFSHSVNASFNNYLSNIQMNISANVTATLVTNQVITNTVQISDAYNSLKNETRYVNTNGTYNITGNYNLSKQLADRKYNISINGLISSTHRVAMSNNERNEISVWRFNERAGLRLNPSEAVEINPYISVDYINSAYSLPSSTNNQTTITALSLDGKWYVLKNLLVGYSASKNLVRGISSNVTNNPFVVNTYLEKLFFADQSASLRIQAFDLFNQNNFINHIVNETGITDIKTSTLSRYVMVSFVVRFQKWSGKAFGFRKGDGGFHH